MKNQKNTPSGGPSEVDDYVQAEARRWLMAINAEGAGVDQAQFRAWLKAAPEHARVYCALEQAWRDLVLSSALDMDIRHAPSRHAALADPIARARRAFSGARRALSVTRRQLVASALVASVLVCVAVALVWQTGGKGENARIATAAYSTGIAQLRTASLPDGSTIALGADTAIAARFSKTARAIRLEHGTAYFDIAHDPSRPVTVEAGNASLHVLGTIFEVWKGPSGVRLSVVRGRVAVGVDGAQTNASGAGSVSPYMVSLGSGERVTIRTDGTLTDVTVFASSDLLSWRKGRLVYRDATLADIVADLNRYRSGPIRILDRRAASLRVTAAFNADQGEKILSGLAASQPIVVRKVGDGLVVRSSD